MSAVPTYKPRAGSSAESAIHHLAAHGPMLATELADAIDVESKAIHAGLGTAVQYGAINQWLEDGRTWYGLPGQAPEAAELVEKATQALTMADLAAQTFEGRDSQQVLKAEPTTADATDRDAPAMASPVGGPMGVGQAAAAAPAGGIRVALWSDKRLQIGETCYSVDETRAIVDYLKAISLESLE